MSAPICPVCKGCNTEQRGTYKSNGVYGPGFRSWPTDTWWSCLGCGVRFDLTPTNQATREGASAGIEAAKPVPAVIGGTERSEPSTHATGVIAGDAQQEEQREDEDQGDPLPAVGSDPSALATLGPEDGDRPSAALQAPIAEHPQGQPTENSDAR